MGYFIRRWKKTVVWSNAAAACLPESQCHTCTALGVKVVVSGCAAPMYLLMTSLEVSSNSHYTLKKWAKLSLNLYCLWRIKRDRKTNTCINKLKPSDYFSYSVDGLNFTHNCICILRDGTSNDGQAEKEAQSFCYQCSSEPFSSLQNVI